MSKKKQVETCKNCGSDKIVKQTRKTLNLASVEVDETEVKCLVCETRYTL